MSPARLASGSRRPRSTRLERALDVPGLAAAGGLVGADADLEDVAGVLGRDGGAAALGDRGEELGDAAAEVPGRPRDLGLRPLAAAVELDRPALARLRAERQHALA